VAPTEMRVPMPEQEDWLPAPGFDGYEVSDLGRVISRRRKKSILLRLQRDDKGYPKVCLMRDGRPVTRLVHQLVAAAFIGPRPEGLEVRHLDGDKDNCRLANLCYGTRSENTFDQVRHGTHVQASKLKCVNGHDFSERNTRFAQGRRWCRACDRDKVRRYNIRKALRAAGIEIAA
jgi:hypothetical protein